MADLNNENNIIISRMQQRRGLKQDLPQPLRPGEFGFAVDSQQLFIGTDDAYAYLTPYQNSCVFETTVNAREHTISIANNQIIAFTVPWIKYSQGQYNGITTVKQWQPSFARSTIDASQQPECVHSSAEKIVFSDILVQGTQGVTALSGSGTPTITMEDLGEIDSTANVRIGDIVTVETLTGNEIANVIDIFRDTLTNDYILEVDKNLSFNAGANLTFKYQSIKNIFTNQVFKTSDVSVRLNGVKLTGDSDNTNTGVPGPEFDYTFSSTDGFSDGTHQLVLNASPRVSDTVTVAYYSNTNVIQAFEGNQVTGNISAYIEKPSFYDTFDIPSYRQIPTENIRVSETTGLGYIALENIHIQSVAEGVNVEATTGLVLGNLLISRDDEQFDLSNCNQNAFDTSIYDLTMDPVLANRFSPVSDTSGAYRFNRVKLVSPGNTFRYFHNRYFDVLSVDPVPGDMTIQIPNKELSMLKTCNVILASSNRYPANGYTGSGSDTVATLIGNSEGVSINDWIRIVDATAGTNQLHDKILKVIAVRSGQVDVRINSAGTYSGNTLPNFTTDHVGLFFTNHGNNAGDVDTKVQCLSINNELSTEVANISVTAITAPYALGDYSIDSNNITENTFFLNTTLGPAQTFAQSGTYHPLLDLSYNNIDVVPILAINLTANTTINQATTAINQPKVITKSGLEPEQIFPKVDFIPQDNGDLNRLYLSQDAGYSSISVGGLEFTLFEDRTTPTLSVLGFTPGQYDRNNHTVKAKLEKWINELVLDRDCNLFTSVLLGGSAYKEFPYTETDTNSPFFNNIITSQFDNYRLIIDDTYNDLLFCDRQEASAFAFLANKVYSQSLFDRATDTRNGIKGLINVRQNLEITTRDQAGIGAQTLSFPATTQAIILRSQTHSTEVFRLPISIYNAYTVEYSINSFGSTAIDTYSRIGSMLAVSNTDIDQVAINDRYSSVYEKVDGQPVVEPRFYAEIDANDIVFKMEEQPRNWENPTPGDTVAHTFDADLLVKFVVRRWSSLEE